MRRKKRKDRKKCWSKITQRKIYKKNSNKKTSRCSNKKKLFSWRRRRLKKENLKTWNMAKKSWPLSTRLKNCENSKSNMKKTWSNIKNPGKRARNHKNQISILSMKWAFQNLCWKKSPKQNPLSSTIVWNLFISVILKKSCIILIITSKTALIWNSPPEFYFLFSKITKPLSWILLN